MNLKIPDGNVDILMNAVKEAADRFGDEAVAAVKNGDSNKYLEVRMKKSILYQIHSQIKNAKEHGDCPVMELQV